MLLYFVLEIPALDVALLCSVRTRPTLNIDSPLSLTESGYIDYSEFCAMMNMMYSDCKTMEAGIKKVFTAIDKNSDEKISSEELRAALSNLSQDVTADDAVNIINTFDRDEDGYINFDGGSSPAMTVFV